MPENAAAVERLLRDSGAKLYTLLYRLTLRADVADDLLQDLALRLLNASGFAASRNPEAFAVRAAQRLAFDWHRQQKRRRETSGPDTARQNVQPNQATQRIENKDELQRVLAALTDLSDAQRECIVLRFLQGEDHEAIAEAIGSTAHRVRAQIRKGIRRLQGLLVSEPESLESGFKGETQ